MTLYQIHFSGNLPVSANPISHKPRKRFEIDYAEGKRHLRWLVIYGDNEYDCFVLANEVLDYLAVFLHTNPKDIS